MSNEALRVALEALPEPMPIFSHGLWLFQETGQSFTGAELNAECFAKYSAAIEAAVAEARAVPEAALRYLRDTAQTGTPNEQAVARTVMHLLSATPSPAEQPVVLTTPDATLPSLGDGPRKKISVTVEVPENWAQRLDMQWVLEREIHADRWSWNWPQPAPVERVSLSDEQILSCVRAIGTRVPMGLTRDRGPYEVTEPTWFLTQLVRAIERAHGIGKNE